MATYFFILSLIASLWAAGWKKKLFIISTLILTVLVILGNVITPLLLKHCISLLSEPASAPFSLIALLLLVYGSSWTISHIMAQLREIIVFNASEECLALLNLKMFDHLHSLSMRFHNERQTGQVINITDRAQSAFTFIMWGFLYIFPTLIEIVVAAGIIFYFYGLIYSALLVLIFAAYAAVTICGDAFMSGSEKKVHEKEADAASYMADSLLNAETVKYFNNQIYEHNHYAQILAQRRTALIKEHTYRQWILIGQSIIAGCGLTLFAVLSGKGILAQTLNISDFVLINGYFLQFIMPLISFGFYARSFNKNISTFKEYLKLLEIEPDIIDTPNALPLIASKIMIEFKDVSFKYNEKTILDSVSFAIPEGKTVAIVGATGAGKSTISRLLYRLYDATEGAIFVNGLDIKTLQQASVQKAIGIVPQDTILFNNTIYYNIAYGNLSASSQEVQNAVKLAGLDHFIDSLPDGYQTLVGERGLKLSGGEKQRIAIARVLLKNPHLYIFDEATSSLDMITEKQIQQNLQTISFGATKLIIAHRLSTVTHADQILVLDQGKIVERGSHQTLLNRKSHYHSLWSQSPQK